MSLKEVSLSLKGLSPHLQTQVKNAIERLLRNRLSQNLKSFSLSVRKQFRSQNKPIFNIKVEITDRFNRSFLVKQTGRHPFQILQSSISKIKSILRKPPKSAGPTKSKPYYIY